MTNIPKPEKLEDQIHFDPLAICDGCGKVGCFVYYTGDKFCFPCMGISEEEALLRIQQRQARASNPYQN